MVSSKILIAVLKGALIATVAAFMAGCGSPFFKPSRIFVDNPAASIHDITDLYFETSDGVTLNGWLVKAEGTSRGTVVALHGYDKNINFHVTRFLWLVEEGFDVFIFDYRGYGRSGGSPGLPRLHLDAEAALKTVFDLPGADRGPVFVYSHSLGGAVAVYAVANSEYRDRIDGLIVESAFASYRRIARERLALSLFGWPLKPIALLIDDSYSPRFWIDRISPVPVLILHGGRDKVVTVDHGVDLFFEAAPPKRLWISMEADHVSTVFDADIRTRLLRHLGGSSSTDRR